MGQWPYNVGGLAGIWAGAAQTVVTPPVGVSLAGYFYDRISKRVRDDLFCRALVLEASGQRIALVALDLVAVAREWADEAKRHIEASVGIAPSNVLICATHTHTGPEVRSSRPMSVHDEWLEALPGKIAETVEKAANNLFEALLFPGGQQEPDLAYNRLGRQKDGTEVFGRTDVIGPAGPIDPELLALGLRDYQGNLRAIVVNYAMHADVIGGGSGPFISADWPGEIAKAVAGVYGDQTVTLFLNGACGDINQIPWEKTRHRRGGPAKAVQLGRALAGLAINAIEKAEPLKRAECGADLQVLEIPYYTRDEQFIAEVEELRQRDDLSNREKATIPAVDNWKMDGQFAQVPVQAMRVGNLAFVGLPGEIFVRWGLEIKHWSPAQYTFVAELANNWFGYVPTTDQAHRGAYGAKPILSRRLDADGGRQMADHIQVMLWKLWEER